jgi:hypothetical protein
LNQLLSAPEFYYWYLIPTAVQIIVLIFSVKYALRKKVFINLFLTVIIFVSIIFSQLLLIRIFFMGAWPSYLPHITTAIAILLIVLQFFKYKTSIR